MAAAGAAVVGATVLVVVACPGVGDTKLEATVALLLLVASTALAVVGTYCATILSAALWLAGSEDRQEHPEPRGDRAA